MRKVLDHKRNLKASNSKGDRLGDKMLLFADVKDEHFSSLKSSLKVFPSLSCLLEASTFF